ncbi:hypothetical protein NJB1907E90_05340, partial [Mycobacterium marinum]
TAEPAGCCSATAEPAAAGVRPRRCRR